eukprot:TRINITY_DN6594_c0_g1_i1.p2 TRINITY_DN6594_c0_g1~~TRINITY_DN6594_c0_g1_i1.p2  ORF type:complete len:431 (+),score=107.87 TRINITY_DN6594_c0_g1_i1:35-1327(+)
MKSSIGILLALCVVAASAVQVREPLHLKLGASQTTALTRASRMLPLQIGGGHVGPVIPLGGNLTVWGEYFVTIGLGNPPQTVQLQVDTGSSDLIVYAKGCKGQCSQPGNAEYDASKSKDFARVGCNHHEDDVYCVHQYCEGFTCGFQDNFGDGSGISGTVGQDRMTLANQASKGNVYLGQIMEVKAPNGFEATGVDGIMGMAFTALSGWHGPNAFQSWATSLSYKNSFSLCLGASGGSLSVGTDFTNSSGWQFTPVYEYQDQFWAWFIVHLEDVQINGKSIGMTHSQLNQHHVIVDSGTTLLLLHPTIFTKVQSTLLAMCSTTNLVGICGVSYNNSLFNNNCFPMTPQQVAQFPTFSFQFHGTGLLPLEPSFYLWEGCGEEGVYALGIQTMKGVGTIFGDVFMQRYNVWFGHGKENRNVGFGPLASCPSM